MTTLTAYIALATLPVALIFRPEPIDIKWNIKHAKLDGPTPPMPPELREASERNARLLQFPAYAVVAGAIYLLMRLSSVPAFPVGFRASRWPSALAVGLGAGAIYVAWLGIGWVFWRKIERRTEALRSDSPPAGRGARDPLACGRVELWVALIVAGCFVEEYWRAFCIVAFESLGHRAAFAVVATSIAFALAFFGIPERSLAFELGRYLSFFGLAVVLAVLFLWSHSLIAPYSAHLLVNLAYVYRARRKHRASKSEPPAAVLCPECGWKISAAELRTRNFPCPNCRQRLRVMPPAGGPAIFALSAVIAIFAPYFLGLRDLGLVLSVPCVFLMSVFGAAYARVLVTIPKLEKVLSPAPGGTSVLGLSRPPGRREK